MLDAKIVGKALQHFREKRNLSQEVVSGFADIARTHLSALERGERKPTLETLFKLSKALGVKASIIMAKIENDIDNEEPKK